MQSQPLMKPVYFLIALAVLTGPAHGDPLDCVLQSGLNFRTLQSGDAVVPLIRKGKPCRFTIMDFRSGQALTYGRPLSEVLNEIQDESGEIACDCALFVQIMTQLQPRADRGIILPSSENYGEVIALAYGRKYAYLRVADSFVHGMLQNTKFRSKGQWLYPLGRGRFAGLFRNEVVTGTKQEWSEWMRDSLVSEIREKIPCASELNAAEVIERRYLRNLAAKGSLDEWHMDYISEAALPAWLKKEIRNSLEKISGSPP
jgi:hypothetical protein